MTSFIQFSNMQQSDIAACAVAFIRQADAMVNNQDNAAT